MSEAIAGTTATAPAHVFSREASGFVRVGSPWRMLLLNVANIGVAYIMFTYWIHPAVFPQGHLAPGVPIGVGMGIFFNLPFGIVPAIMPRPGSEFGFLTRT